MNTKRLLTSCFGLGWLPIAPGTWGSLPPTAIFAGLCYFGVSPLTVSIVMLVLILAGSVICVKFAPASIDATGKIDPGEVVADELAGQAVTFVYASAYVVGFNQILITAILGFLLFRVFDIIKPWPIRKLEKFPKGWGILADDLLAGVYAAIILQICLRFWVLK
ncbi:MAG: phosphatidylglycerophosphatase A [Planctomycetes bacterium]|nr:phosphatidylglycerophosphatase A [Planctomycetota bacterium]